MAPPTARNGSARPSAKLLRNRVLIRLILLPATPPPPPDSAAAKTLRAAVGTPNGPPSQAHRIVTPASTPDAQNKTDGKYPPIYSTLRSTRVAIHHRSQRLPPRATDSSMVNASGADPPRSLQQMVEAVIAAAIATINRHFAHMGRCPAPVAQPLPPAGPVAPTTHPAAVPTDTVPPFISPASVAPPPPPAGPVATSTDPAAVPTDKAYPTVAPSPVSTLPPPSDAVVPTAHSAPAPTRTAPAPCDLVRPRLKRPLDTGLP